VSGVSIEDELQSALTDAMRSKDKAVLDAIRNVRTEAQKAKTAASFDGNDDDAFYTAVISTYVKTLSKSLETYEDLGARGAEQAAKLRTEIEYLSRWLPSKLDETATGALVDEAIAEVGSDPKMAGRIMGHIMKDHGQDVDPALVKRLVEERLSGA
jgi:uncharacterized protein YqeY